MRRKSGAEAVVAAVKPRNQITLLNQVVRLKTKSLLDNVPSPAMLLTAPEAGDKMFPIAPVTGLLVKIPVIPDRGLPPAPPLLLGLSEPLLGLLWGLLCFCGLLCDSLCENESVCRLEK